MDKNEDNMLARYNLAATFEERGYPVKKSADRLVLNDILAPRWLAGGESFLYKHENIVD